MFRGVQEVRAEHNPFACRNAECIVAQCRIGRQVGKKALVYSSRELGGAAGTGSAEEPSTTTQLFMKSLIQSMAILVLLMVLTNCTAYVDPNGIAPAATTTTRTISDPYSPDASVTTEKTTTRY